MNGTEPQIDRHNPTVLYARGHHWIECSCGWMTLPWSAQVGAVVEHGHHVTAAKAADRG